MEMIEKHEKKIRGTNNNNNNNKNNNNNNNNNNTYKKQTVAIAWVPKIGLKIKKEIKKFGFTVEF